MGASFRVVIYSEADRDFFDQLLPLEGIDPNDPEPEREVEPAPRDFVSGMEVRARSDVRLERSRYCKMTPL